MPTIAERISELASEPSISLDELTPERLLGISSEEADRARRAFPGHSLDEASRDLSRALVCVRNKRSLVITHRSGGVRSRTLREIGRAVNAVGLEHDVDLIVCVPTRSSRIEVSANGAVVLHLPRPQQATDRIRIGRQLVACRLDNDPSITVRGVAVALASPDDHDPGHYWLAINPFAHDGKLSGSNAQRRAALLSEVIAAIREADGLPGSVPSDVADAVQTLDLLAPVIKPLRESIGTRSDDIRRQLQASREAADAARERLMRELRQQRELTAELEALSSSANQVGTGLVQRALVEVLRIKGNRCVHSVRITNNDGVPHLDVTLHPLVLEDYRDGRHLLDQMRFRMPLLVDGRAPMPVWERAEPSPHPHVSNSGSTCWGDAAQPIAEAMSRGEFSTVVRFISTWATIYNSDSPYVELSAFPVAQSLEPGWHPELPVRV